MPSDERYRSAVMAPRPYRIVGKDVAAPGEMTLTLIPDFSPGLRMMQQHEQAAAGQFWILSTRHGAQIPAVATSTPPSAEIISVPPSGRSATEPYGTQANEVTTLRVPCEPLIGSVGDQVTMRGPLGQGFDLSGRRGCVLLVIAWESALMVVRPVIEQALAGRLFGGFSRLRVWGGAHRWQAIPYQSQWNRWSAGAGVTVSASPTLTMAAAAREVDLDVGNTLALLAGPWPMAVATAAALARRGMPAEQIQLAAHTLLQCGTGGCGRCKITSPRRALRACTDGPVLRYDQLTAPPPEQARGG